MSRTAVPLCHCARCRVDQAGLGPGPYTPAEYAKITPATVVSSSDDPVSRDPAVKATQLAVREARDAYQPFETAWLEAAAAHRRADLAPDQTVSDGRGGLFSLGGRRRLARVGELERHRKETREAMELAWRDVVKANEKLRDATLAARRLAAEAERGG
jgi:hypothetical protein